MIKKLILGILGLVVAAVVILCVVVAMQPSHFTIIRSATFSAPPEALYTQVNDFHNWQAWSPWAKIDPNMKTTLSGPPSGKGASYAWIGNDEVGEGNMTIVDSKPSEAIKIALEFIRPFAMKSDTDFTFKPDGNKTTMTWAMSGENNFVGKAFGLFMNVDKMVGADFEKGMAQLKPIVESGSAK
jgi:hypothetical protein